MISYDSIFKLGFLLAGGLEGATEVYASPADYSSQGSLIMIRVLLSRVDIRAPIS